MLITIILLSYLVYLVSRKFTTSERPNFHFLQLLQLNRCFYIIIQIQRSEDPNCDEAHLRFKIPGQIPKRFADTPQSQGYVPTLFSLLEWVTSRHIVLQGGDADLVHSQTNCTKVYQSNYFYNYSLSHNNDPLSQVWPLTGVG